MTSNRPTAGHGGDPAAGGRRGRRRRGVGFTSLQESIDTTTPGGKLVFRLFGNLAAFERDLLREQTAAGRAGGWARGATGRRPRPGAAESPGPAAPVREVGRWVLPAAGVRSLVWSGDVLLDPAGGWARFDLDGAGTCARILEPGQLARYSLERGAFLSRVSAADRLGTLVALEGFVVGFYEHPKLVDLQTGEVVARWPDLPSGKQAGSIIQRPGPPPPLALDPANRRFAVAGPDGITVVQLG